MATGAPIPKAAPRGRWLWLWAMAFGLVAYLFADVDDLDSQLYSRIAQNVLASGDLWHLSWTKAVLSDFHEHLPPLFWLLALARRLVGPLGARIAFAGMALATWWSFYELAARAGMAEAARKGLWLVPLTEAYFSAQTWPRLDQPYLLLFVLSLLLARDGRGWGVLASAACAGGAMLLRPPMALSLLVLAPAAALAHRSWSGRRPLVGRADGARLCAFAAMALAFPLALHLADLAWGPGDVWARYLRDQVLASLSGARGDGAASHFAPLRFLGNRFWPGLPLAALGAALALKKKELRGHPFAALSALWTGAILAGLSLGKRHVGHHVWAAYPPLFLFAGLGLAALSQKLRLGPAGEQQAARAMAALCGALALAVPWLYAPSEPLLAARATQALKETVCERIAIAAANPAWRMTIPIAHHFQRDIAFVAAAGVQRGEGCLQVVAVYPGAAVPTSWRPLFRGKQIAFFGAE